MATSKLNDILQHDCIALDTNVFIYALEGNRFFPAASELFRRLSRIHPKVVTSVLTLLEITVPLFRLHQEQRLPDYIDFVRGQGRIIIVDIDTSVSLLAAKLRAEHRLKTPDAIQLSAALSQDAMVFVTADRDYGIRTIDSMTIEVIAPVRATKV